MFEKGQKFRMFKGCAAPDKKDIRRMVKAEVAYVPNHGKFVSFRFFYINLFGEHTSYRESFQTSELKQMLGTGHLVRR